MKCASPPCFLVSGFSSSQAAGGQDAPRGFLFHRFRRSFKADPVSRMMNAADLINQAVILLLLPLSSFLSWPYSQAQRPRQHRYGRGHLGVFIVRRAADPKSYGFDENETNFACGTEENEITGSTSSSRMSTGRVGLVKGGFQRKTFPGA